MIKENGRTTWQTGIEAEIEIDWLQLRSLLEQAMLQLDEKPLPYHEMLLFSITEEEMDIFAIDPSNELKTHLSVDKSVFKIVEMSNQIPIKALVDSRWLIKRMKIAVRRKQQVNIPPSHSGKVNVQFVNQDAFGFIGEVAINSRHKVTVGCQSTEKVYNWLPREMRLSFLGSGTIELENVQNKPSVRISSDSLTKLKEIVCNPRLLSIGTNTFKEGPDIDISLEAKSEPHIIVEDQNGLIVSITSSNQLDRIARTLSKGTVELYSSNHGQSIYQSKDSYTIQHQILPKKHKVISGKV